MTTPITMTTSMIKTTTIMMTAITDVVTRSVRVGVDAVGVDAVGVDAVERKHTTWHGARRKQRTEHRNMTVTYHGHILDITRLTSPYPRFPL